MKKFLSLFVIAIVLLTVTGCGKSSKLTCSGTVYGEDVKVTVKFKNGKPVKYTYCEDGECETETIDKDDEQADMTRSEVKEEFENYGLSCK